MIFVAGTMTLDATIMDHFTRDVAEMAGKVRNEQGCHHYSLLVEDAPAGLVNVLEWWDDDAALVVHLKQPWILEFLSRYGPHLRASTVKVFDISGIRALPAT